MANNSGLRTSASCAARARVKERKKEEAATEKRLEEEKETHKVEELKKRERTDGGATDGGRECGINHNSCGGLYQDGEQFRAKD